MTFLDKSLWVPSLPWWNLLVRGTIVYAAVVLLMRLGGKRQIGQMGVGEFVAVLLISNAVQNAMNGGDNSLTGGLLLAGILIIWSVLTSYLTYRSKRWALWLEGRPVLLVHQGKILTHHLEREFLNVHELKIMLRHQGITNLEQVEEAVLESDGQLSIVKKSGL